MTIWGSELGLAERKSECKLYHSRPRQIQIPVSGDCTSRFLGFFHFQDEIARPDRFLRPRCFFSFWCSFSSSRGRDEDLRVILPWSRECSEKAQIPNQFCIRKRTGGSCGLFGGNPDMWAAVYWHTLPQVVRARRAHLRLPPPALRDSATRRCQGPTLHVTTT